MLEIYRKFSFIISSLSLVTVCGTDLRSKGCLFESLHCVLGQDTLSAA